MTGLLTNYRFSNLLPWVQISAFLGRIRSDSWSVVQNEACLGHQFGQERINLFTPSSEPAPIAQGNLLVVGRLLWWMYTLWGAPIGAWRERNSWSYRFLYLLPRAAATTLGLDMADPLIFFKSLPEGKRKTRKTPSSDPTWIISYLNWIQNHFLSLKREAAL